MANHPTPPFTVECIRTGNNSYFGEEVVQGMKYQVEEVDSLGGYRLAGQKVYWRSDRFNILSATATSSSPTPTSTPRVLFMVKCVRGSTYVIPPVVKGQTYEVVWVSNNGKEYQVKGNTNEWDASRFEVLQQPTTAAVSPAHTSSTVDLSDWRVWRSKPAEGMCVCGCRKELCFIHKEG